MQAKINTKKNVQILKLIDELEIKSILIVHSVLF